MSRTIGLVALAAGTALPAMGATVVYTNRTNWETATGTWTTETFTGNVIGEAGVSFNSNTGFGTYLSGDAFHDRILQNTGTTWNFAFPIIAWGADFNLAGPGGPGSGIAVSIELFAGNTLVGVSTIPGTTNNFWGFTSTQAFDSVRLAHPGNTASVETYDMDNLSFNDHLIPLPHASGMAMAGMGLLALRRRRAPIA